MELLHKFQVGKNGVGEPGIIPIKEYMKVVQIGLKLFQKLHNDILISTVTINSIYITHYICGYYY